MATTWDRAISSAVAGAICLMAAAIAKRTFLDGPDKGPPPILTFESGWLDLLTVGRTLGPPDARVNLVEIADLQCPGCRRFQSVIDDLLEKFRGDLAVTFVHFPLSYHLQAMEAHRGSECAHRSGRFAAFVRSVYAKQESLPFRSPWHFARDAGISDSVAFHRCLIDTASTDVLISAAVEAANRVEANRTPTIIVNGWRVNAIPHPSYLEDLIEDLIQGKSSVTDTAARY